MNVLVTGGAGYLGNIVCRKLLNKGYKVRCLDKLYFGREPIADLLDNSSFELVPEDIRNQESIFKVLKNIDKVIHLASLVGDPVCDAQPNFAYEINWVATTNLVKACKLLGINRFLFASTCSVYGCEPGKILSEESKPNPVSLYARAKLECENCIMQELTEPLIFRMGTIYGYSRRMRFDLVVNYFIARAIKKEPINVFGGLQARPFIHVDDAANGFILGLESDNQGIFNLSEGNYVIRETAEVISKLMSVNSINIIGEMTDKRDYSVSCEKLSKAFPFQAVKTIEDAVEEIKEAFPEVDYTLPAYNNYLLEVK